ncbi:MAG: FAD-binding oxidoreductase [Spirochaetales bacterium]|nr:FAD-binding oxidoreductase [Spirochaetales bacterium]
MGKSKGYQPDWSEKVPEKGSYRSVFKWGAPDGFKHPKSKMYQYMKDQFGLTDDDFRTKEFEGREQVAIPDKPSLIDKKHVEAITKIVGSENISLSDYDRLFYSTGKTMEEALELRQNLIGDVTDLVVHPRHTQDVSDIVKYCNDHKIPLYTFGGGSSVNFGFRPTKGGVTLVLNTHMNKVLEINELNKTATVQSGMMGPAYEAVLNNSKKSHKTKKNYTCGHFPQSFEYSSVGGWVAALGSGQESSYFGDACDIVMGVEFVSPKGVIQTHVYPATASGPKVLDMIKGSEGCYGVITALTMKIFYHSPETKYGFSYVFRTWEDGVNACREISQGEFGFPGVMRISDPEETAMGLRLYGVAGTPLDPIMKVFGYKDGTRCLFLARTCGEKGFAKNVRRKAKRICRKHGGMSLTKYALSSWEHGRYKDPYLREDLNDYAMILDTTESGVTWDNLHALHKGVREYVKSRPNTGCLTHASHFYPGGTNLYFIFFCKMNDMKEYQEFQTGIFDAINKYGGSLSHHHGVGRMIGPWMQEHLGDTEMGAIKALKQYFDPNNIMNPGGNMGMDYDKSELKDHNWRIDWKKHK